MFDLLERRVNYILGFVLAVFVSAIFAGLLAGLITLIAHSIAFFSTAGLAWNFFGTTWLVGTTLFIGFIAYPFLTELAEKMNS